MSTFGIVAFVVLPVLGGLIAWAGDVIGYRLGKSRRSLFGLRPRSTARVVGIAVGVALPLFGLLTAVLGSRSARDALLHMDRLRAQEAALIGQVDALEKRVAEAQALVKRSEKRRLELTRSLRVATGELVAAQKRVSAANNRLNIALRSVARLQGEAADLRAARETLLQARALLHQQIAGLERRSGALQADVARLRENLRATDNELAKVDRNLTLATAALSARQAELDRQIAAVNSPIVFESGHELLRAILEVQDTVEATQTKVAQMLVAAGEAAAAQGAEVGTNGLAVRLVGPLPATVKPGDELPPDKDILRPFAADLQQAGKRKFVVGVRVARRMYEAEQGQARVELWALPYVRAFAKDELIYAVNVDGSLPRSEVFTQLWNLVTKLVRREAQERGLLRDPDTQQYGSLPAKQILEALDRISEAKGPVRVEVRAAKDTYVSEPLAIRISIRSEESAASRGNSTRG